MLALSTGVPIRALEYANQLQSSRFDHDAAARSAGVRSALVLAHVRGALMLELARASLAVHEYTALQVKKAVVGHGHAGKEQVRSMVCRLLRVDSLPAPHDVSDALADRNWHNGRVL